MPARLVLFSFVTTTAIACDGTVPAPSAEGSHADAAASPDGARDAGEAPFVPSEGARLKARWFEGPDGQRSFLGFYDAELRSECDFSRAADGELRCLPRARYLSEKPDWADAACSEPVVWAAQSSCQDALFVTSWDTSNLCERRERIFRLGSAVPDGRTYYKDRGGGCVPAPEFPGYVAYRVADELPASTFVRASLTAEPTKTGDPLQLLVLEADDGARLNHSFRNAEGGYDCALALLADGRVHCLPPSASVFGFAFADAACGQPAATTAPTCGAPPPVARSTSTVEVALGTCASVSTVHELGPILDRSYSGSSGMCRAAPSPRGLAYHGLGERISPETFIALAQVTERSMHDVWPTRLVAPGGTAVAYGWFDGKRNAPCFPVPVAGKQRCAPDGARLDGFFADEACTQPVLRATRGACLARYALRFDDSTCPGEEQVYSVGARYAGIVHEQVVAEGQTSVECRFATSVAPTDVFHEVTPVPADEFPEMKLIEPRR